MVQLIATDGELTVVRRLAAAAYGTWKVEWPDSVPEDQRPILDDDREHGYVSHLADHESMGLMGRRFIRADVSITAAEYNEHGEPEPHTGYTDAETVLDAAATQTAEEALIERAITRAGLGDLVPGADFDVGHVANVLVWGKTVQLPVTQIEAVTQAGAVIDWRVMVGGQLIADHAERERTNDEIRRTVWAERRERLKDVEKATEKATKAQQSADDAALDAKAADEKAVQAGQKADKSLEQVEDTRAELQTVTANQETLTGKTALLATSIGDLMVFFNRGCASALTRQKSGAQRVIVDNIIGEHRGCHLENGQWVLEEIGCWNIYAQAIVSGAVLGLLARVNLEVNVWTPEGKLYSTVRNLSTVSGADTLQISRDVVVDRPGYRVDMRVRSDIGTDVRDVAAGDDSTFLLVQHQNRSVAGGRGDHIGGPPPPDPIPTPKEEP